MTDTTREDFEAFYLTVDKTADFQRAANNGHDYYFDSEQDAWRFWQAATRQANQWRPIADAPRSADDILALNRAGRQTIKTGHYLHNMMAAAIVDEEDCYYTGWLPLPPTGTGGNV